MTLPMVTTVSAPWLADLQSQLSATQTLLSKLAIDMPWTWSTEGLDDCCQFCGSDRSTWLNPGHIYIHLDDCIWLEAREYLGRSQPEHRRVRDGSNSADGSQA